MGEIRTRALVLRTFDQGESDRIVHLFTERCGRVSAIAKGAKRSRRRFPGTLEILTVADVRLVDPPRSSLMRLEGARLVEPFEGLVEDLGRFGLACQLLELLDRFTGEREAHPELFRFARGALGVLRQEAPDPLLGLLLRAKTLAWMGYRPQLVACAQCGAPLGEAETVGFEPRHGGGVCPDCSELAEERVHPGILAALERGIRSPLRERAALGLGPPQVALASHLLGRFFLFHLGQDLRSGRFAEWALVETASQRSRDISRAREPDESALDGPERPGDTSRQPTERVLAAPVELREPPGA